MEGTVGGLSVVVKDLDNFRGGEIKRKLEERAVGVMKSKDL